jgi:hypothetical protein
MENPIKDQIIKTGEIIIPKKTQELIDAYAKTNTDSNVQTLINYIKTGYSFSQAKTKVDSQNASTSENLENFPWIRNDV